MSLTHGPLAKRLSAADDRVRLSHWLPPQAGVVPRIGVGQRWTSVLWALPMAFLSLLIGVAVSQALRQRAPYQQP